ncbi:MAG TPA: LamG-like jellyroll fold domain-containing protein [Arenibaculum sp.]|nr:LamG-like jellyroll fold domain-containing protein [Arenibaculum sp.]
MKKTREQPSHGSGTEGGRALRRNLEPYCAAYVACLLLVLLAPFQVRLPVAPNGATPTPDGRGIVFDRPGLMRLDNGADPLVRIFRETRELTVEAWAEPAGTKQGGPARIVTIARDPLTHNFLLGQDGDDLIVRLLTSSGQASGLREQITVPGVFARPGRRHLAVTFGNGVTTVHVDGTAAVRRTAEGSLAAWRRGQQLVLGNDAGGNRPWAGTLHGFALFDAALDTREIALRHAAGPAGLEISVPDGPGFARRLRVGPGGGPSGGMALRLSVPPVFGTASPNTRFLGIVPVNPLTEPIPPRMRRDIAVNFLVFLPVGFGIAMTVRRRGRPAVRAAVTAALFGAALSLTCETLQYFIVARYSSLVDLAANSAGSAAGAGLALLAMVARRHLGAAKPGKRVMP